MSEDLSFEEKETKLKDLASAYLYKVCFTLDKIKNTYNRLNVPNTENIIASEVSPITGKMYDVVCVTKNGSPIIKIVDSKNKHDCIVSIYTYNIYSTVSAANLFWFAYLLFSTEEKWANTLAKIKTATLSEKEIVDSLYDEVFVNCFAGGKISKFVAAATE